MILKSQKHIHVTCAIIEHDGLVLAAQRSASMSMPLKWEFPGGKINSGESPEACLVRELKEELEIVAKIIRPLSPVTHHYPSFVVTLYPYICKIDSGQLILNEHAAISWRSLDELQALDWAEADIPIVIEYKKLFGLSGL
jgi:8-oxo-dGTP diphosphatase